MTAQFTTVQQGPASTGTTSVALTLSTGVTSGNHLVAGIMTGGASATLTPPNGNWRLASSQAYGGSANGHIEVWYLEGKYQGGGGTSFTFTGDSGVSLSGCVNEVAAVSGLNPGIVLDATGSKGGSGGLNMTVAGSCGNAADDFGFLFIGNRFSSAPSGTWTNPAGWNPGASVGNQQNCFYSATKGDLAQGNTSVTSGFSTSASETGFAWVFVAFRVVYFYPLLQSGGESCNICCQTPNSDVILLGGDVEGMWRSADQNPGDHWFPNMTGLYETNTDSIACAFWSLTEPGYLYVGTGRIQGGGGGLLASPDGGVTWTVRNQKIQFNGNYAASPPATDGQSDRTIGHHMIAQDAANGYTYFCAAGGFYRSSTNGNGFTDISPVAGCSPRCVLLNPSNPKELWVGVWANFPSGSVGGVYHIADATAPSGTGDSRWDQLTGFTGTAADIIAIGNYIYVAANVSGLYHYKYIGGSGTDLKAINGDGTVANGLKLGSGIFWNHLDGWADGSGNHQLLLSCAGNSPQGASSKFTNDITNITIPSHGDGTPSFTDMTGNATYHFTTMPPDGRGWWKFAHGTPGYKSYLGGGAMNHCTVASDPNNRSAVYVAGSGGFFRTQNFTPGSGSMDWYVASNGVNGLSYHVIALDPNNPNHAIMCGDDFAHVDINGDLTGATASDITVTGFGSGLESHAVCFRRSDSYVAAGTNQKYGKATNGGVFLRPGNSAGSSAWSPDVGYAAYSKTGGAAVTGLFMGTDGGGTHFIIAVSEGNGLFRATQTGSNPQLASSWTWSQPSSGAAIGANGSSQGIVPVTGGLTSDKFIYVLDRAPGKFWASSDYGVTWTLVWNFTSSFVGMAMNPATSGEMWITTNASSNAIWKLSNIASGTVAGGQVTATAIGGGGPSKNPLGIGFYQGSVYVVWGNSSSHPSAQLMTTNQLNSTSPTWTDVNPSGEIAATVTAPKHQVVINSSGFAMINTSENGATVGFLGAPPVASLTWNSSGAQVAGTVGQAYTCTLSVTGGKTPYTFTVQTGSLPPGLSFDPANPGVISGTPTTAGTFTFTSKVTDSTTPTAQTAISASLSITISPAPVMTLSPSSGFPAGTIGVAYPAQTLTVTGGTGPWTWSVVAGSGGLPPGLNLGASTSSTNTISGTPTAYGGFPFTIQVTDSGTNVATQAYSITIPPSGLQVTTTSLPPVTAGQPYQALVAASGGVPPYTWAVVNTTGTPDGGGTGSLPAGISLDPNSGILNGETTAIGATPLTFQVADSLGATAIAVLVLSVAALTWAGSYTALPG